MNNENNDFVLYEFKNNLDLDRYNKELMEDVKITTVNLPEKSRTLSQIRAKWLNHYFQEQDNLKRIKKGKEKLLKSKMGPNKVSGSVLRMKSEDNIINNDEQMQTLNSLQENVKTTIDFIEHALNVLNDFGYNIRNEIDLLKLQNG